jgi:hypothetical protein
MDWERQDTWKVLCAVLPLALMSLAPARADQIKVNWGDPEIQTFARDKAAHQPMTLGISQADRISALKLPVLAFDSIPQLVRNVAPQGLAPTAPTRQVLMNEADPTWYQINDQYGDVSISVAASLTVHHDVPKSTIYTPTTPQDVSSGNDPQIQVFDENGEPGFQGVILEYTVYKYPDIPYTITIECTQQAKEKCRDLATVAKDKDLLKLISAQAPR